MTIKTFLETLRHTWPPSILTLRLVTGNQSADMDSVVSAIMYAYFHHQSHVQESPIYPLVNIHRDEFWLRKDILHLLRKHEICSSLLFFVDDVETYIKQAPTAFLDVVLVDHCNVQGELLTRLYEEKTLRVTGIIDHHFDEGAFPDAVPRLIWSSGSCTSHIFNYWNSHIGPLNDKDAARLLLGPLLIDTSKMQQKVEAGDRDAYAAYGRILSDPVSAPESRGSSEFTDSFSELFMELKTAKNDLGGFSLYDILRKDFKQFKFQRKTGTSSSVIRVGFSSIGKSLSWILTKFAGSEVLHALQDMALSFHLDVVVITSSFTRKDTRVYTREFCFSTHIIELQELASKASELQLSTGFYKEANVAEALAQINNAVLFKVYNQQNTAASRKQVVPVIKEVIEHRL